MARSFEFMRFFPVSQPSIGTKEIAYVTEAVSSGWVSSIGKYIEQFETSFAAFCGTQYGLATSNGTTGLHLALAAFGVKAGDEVIVPDLTFVATANVVRHANATPVMVDVDERTLCIDPSAIRRAITPRTRAIIPVHLYGHPAQMDAIVAIGREHDLIVIEDAAEAHGAEYHGRRVGSIGDTGVFSFYGNKVITSGEGGMLTTNNREFYLKAKSLRDHAMSSEKRYWHTEVGYNYRMTNLQAALAVAQMERIEEFLEKRRKIMGWYRAGLETGGRLHLNYDEPGCKNAYWMVCLEIDGITEEQRTQLMSKLRERGVDSRPYFYPISDMPMYQRSVTPVAHKVSGRGINLPSYVDLSEQDVADISAITRAVLGEMHLL
jgi:perosamine synthetase